MATIIPGWEWRTFGRRFGIAEKHFAELAPAGIQESDELYLLGGAGENVKIRDDLLDIKVLREVDAAGLERWEPVMKKGFPLPKADVVSFFASFPPSSRPSHQPASAVTSIRAIHAACAPSWMERRSVTR